MSIQFYQNKEVQLYFDKSKASRPSNSAIIIATWKQGPEDKQHQGGRKVVWADDRRRGRRVKNVVKQACKIVVPDPTSPAMYAADGTWLGDDENAPVSIVWLAESFKTFMKTRSLHRHLDKMVKKLWNWRERQKIRATLRSAVDFETFQREQGGNLVAAGAFPGLLRAIYQSQRRVREQIAGVERMKYPTPANVRRMLREMGQRIEAASKSGEMRSTDDALRKDLLVLCTLTINAIAANGHFDALALLLAFHLSVESKEKKRRPMRPPPSPECQMLPNSRPPATPWTPL